MATMTNSSSAPLHPPHDHRGCAPGDPRGSSSSHHDSGGGGSLHSDSGHSSSGGGGDTGRGRAPSHRLQLSLRARRLKNTAGRLRKSDPFAVVLSLGSSHPGVEVSSQYRGGGGASPPRILGRTEVIQDDLDPCWTTVFIVDEFRFGVPNYVEVGVFDYDRAGKTADAEEMDGATVDRNDLMRSAEYVDYQTSGGGDCAAAAGDGRRRSQRNSGGSASSHHGGSATTSIDDSIRRSLDISSSGHAALRALRADHVCMGTAVFELGDLLGTRGNVRCKQLRAPGPSNGGGAGGGGAGQIYAQVLTSRTSSSYADKGYHDAGSMLFQIRGMKLKNTYSDLLNRRSDPFYEIYRREDRPQGADWNSIYRSSTIRENLNPYWDHVEMDLEKFCNGDLDRSIRVVVFDRRRGGRHRFMGEFETTVRRFAAAKGRTRSDLDMAFDLRNKEGSKVGSIVVVEARISEPRGTGEGEGKGEGKGEGEGGGGESFCSAGEHLKPASMPERTHEQHQQHQQHQQQQQQPPDAPSPTADIKRSMFQSGGRENAFRVPGGTVGGGDNSDLSNHSRHSSDSEGFVHHGSDSSLPPSAANNSHSSSLHSLRSVITASDHEVEVTDHLASLTLGEVAAAEVVPCPPPQAQAQAVTPGYHYRRTIQHHPPPPPPAAQPAPPVPRHRRPTFVDYLAGGCEISLSVALDFTASNGDPSVPGSPHHVSPDPKQLNDYEEAITSVGSVLAKYDADRMFPVWGFGAKMDGRVRHCFQVGERAEVQGVEGMLGAYRSVFRGQLVMSYPTVFTEVVRSAARDASNRLVTAQREGRLSYSVLLLLTVGNVDDVVETMTTLAEASKSPLSVVIVGIGDDDFCGMRFLDEFGEDAAAAGGGGGDGDEEEEEWVRDITQFIKFNDYRSPGTGSARSTYVRHALLSEAVLEEIPDQLVEYFLERRGLMPPGETWGASPMPMCNGGVSPSSGQGIDDGTIPVNPQDRESSGFFQ